MQHNSKGSNTYSIEALEQTNKARKSLNKYSNVIVDWCYYQLTICIVIVIVRDNGCDTMNNNAMLAHPMPIFVNNSLYFYGMDYVSLCPTKLGPTKIHRFVLHVFMTHTLSTVSNKLLISALHFLINIIYFCF